MATKSKQMMYTKEGFAALLEELKYLKGTKREEVKEAIATARSFGDLSENSEYDEARNEQAKVEARIKELEELIDNALVVDETAVDTSVISIGSTVKVFNKNTNKEIEYNIVGSNEADPINRRISDQSPIGRALMGKSAGDELGVDAPNGIINLKVIEVTRK